MQATESSEPLWGPQKPWREAFEAPRHFASESRGRWLAALRGCAMEDLPIDDFSDYEALFEGF